MPCGEHFTRYTNIKSFCCTPETHITLHLNYLSIQRCGPSISLELTRAPPNTHHTVAGRGRLVRRSSDLSCCPFPGRYILVYSGPDSACFLFLQRCHREPGTLLRPCPPSLPCFLLPHSVLKLGPEVARAGGSGPESVPSSRPDGDQWHLTPAA